MIDFTRVRRTALVLVLLGGLSLSMASWASPSHVTEEAGAVLKLADARLADGDEPGALELLQKMLDKVRACDAGCAIQLPLLLEQVALRLNRPATAAIAAQILEEALTLQPQARARASLLRNLAVVRGWKLDQFAQAAAELEQAAVILEALGDEGRDDRVAALLTLTNLYLNTKQFDARARVIESTLLPLLFHPAYDANAVRLRTRGYMFYSLRRFGEAASSYQASANVLRLQRPLPVKALGDVLWDLGKSYLGLGLEARTADSWIEAIRLGEEAQPGVVLAEARTQLASVLVTNLHRYDEALKLYDSILADHRARLGEDSPKIDAVLKDVGFVRLRQGRYAEAENLYGQVLARIKARPAGPTTVAELQHVVITMAQVAERSGRTELAATRFAEGEALAVASARTTLDLVFDAHAWFLERASQPDRALLLRFRSYALFPGPRNGSSFGSNLMRHPEHGQKIGIARMFFKRQVLNLQAQRKDIARLGSTAVADHDRQSDDAYIALANMLISTGRALEAEQVLLAKRSGSLLVLLC